MWIGDSLRYVCVLCWYRNDLFSTTTTKEDAQLRHWRLFSRGTCSDTWAKGAAVATPWLWKDNGYIRGNISHTVVVPIRTPHAWPTSLITRTGVASNRSITFAGVHLSNYGESKAHSELQIYNAACYDLYQENSLFTCTLTRCNLCTASRFIRSGVASMESHSSMADKKNRNMKMTTELEVYLPVPSSVET